MAAGHAHSLPNSLTILLGRTNISIAHVMAHAVSFVEQHSFSKRGVSSGSSMKFREIPIEEVNWQALDTFSSRTYSQRKPWLDYLSEIAAGTPIIAALEDGQRQVGWFTGMLTSPFGLRMIGSPFKGWNTIYMGLNLEPGIPRAEALRALSSFAFNEKQCVYLELSDPESNLEDARNAGFQVYQSHGYRTDLTCSEQDLLLGMAKDYRSYIRRALENGVTVEEASPEGFADDFYAQLEDVFAHQGLRPTYGKARIETLVRCVYPSGSLLLLRARSKSGQSIATGVFPGFYRYSSFWGNGSIRTMLNLRPNQALMWYAMRYWKARGAVYHDWGGGGAYKAKYGPVPYRYTIEFKAIVPGLARLRDPALRAFYSARKVVSLAQKSWRDKAQFRRW